MSDIYTTEWFADRVDGQVTKMEHAGALDELLHPASVIDVGCATGNMLLWWARYRGGVRIVGVEKYALEARPAMDSNVGRWILHGDAGEPGWWQWFNCYDLAICVEVAEHMEPGTEHTLVEGLCRLSDQVFFTAARPGQHGDGHTNCRERKFWVALFSEQGYERDTELVKQWRKLVTSKQSPEVGRNAMFFRKTS